MIEEKDTENMEEFVPEDPETTDDVELEDEEASFGDKAKKLREKLAACEKEKMTYLEGWQRSKADFLNLKRRTEEEAANLKAFGTIKHIEKLLPLADSFEIAMSNKKAWEDIDPIWRTGIEQVRKELHQIFKSYGVEELVPEGEPFDPKYHEAISNVPVGDEKLHEHVVSVIQRGYKIGDVLIRPARVTVGVFEK